MDEIYAHASREAPRECCGLVVQENDNEIYIEDSTGYWKKYEYDANGNLIYSEDSNGRIYDNR